MLVLVEDAVEAGYRRIHGKLLARRGQVKVDPDAKDCPSRRQGMLPQPERFPGRH